MSIFVFFILNLILSNNFIIFFINFQSPQNEKKNSTKTNTQKKKETLEPKQSWTFNDRMLCLAERTVIPNDFPNVLFVFCVVYFFIFFLLLIFLFYNYRIPTTNPYINLTCILFLLCFSLNVESRSTIWHLGAEF